MDWECCWYRDDITLGDCPNIREGDEDLLVSSQRRILEKCCDCPRFKRDLERFQVSGHPLGPVFSLIYDEYRRQKINIHSLKSFLDSKSLEIRFFHELGSVLQSSVDLEEVLSVALTAITAGRGFGMNRAFLLMTDHARDHLLGYLAIGPRNYEEAYQVWEEIANNDMDLQTLAQSFRKNKLSAERAKFHDILEKISVPLSNTTHILIKTLNGKQPVLIEDAYHHPDVDPDFARLLGVDTFLLMPLISRSRRVGVIIADNCITHRRITAEDMHSLETFTFPVAVAIERAYLYEQLQEELHRVTAAHTKLKEQQELIVRMEKMALVGRITSSIAHSIRNPLMIIGGFARSMLKNTPAGDPKRNFIESIVSEARQLEGVLDEVLNYSDSLYPSKDFWDVNQLVETTLRDSATTLRSRGYESNFSAGSELPPAYIDFKQVSYCLRTIFQCDLHGSGFQQAIDISTRRENDAIIIRIRDRGQYVSQKELDAFLVPFSPPQELGTGLGLALCRTILEKQGIPLSAQSVPEVGITFTIALPIRKEDL